MSPNSAALFCLLCLPMATEANSAGALPTNAAIIILAVIAGVFSFITVVLVVLVCWCCCGRGNTKCSQVLPASTSRARKTSYSTSPSESTELDSVSSKRTSCTDLSLHAESQGGVIVRAVSKEYIRQDGEKVTYVSTRSASTTILEKPSPFVSHKPAEGLPFRNSPLLGRRVAWSDLQNNTDETAEAGVKESSFQPQQGEAAQGAHPTATAIENQHARDVEYDDDDVFAPLPSPNMDTDLSLPVESSQTEEAVLARVSVPPTKQPVARTDSTMPLLEEGQTSEPTTPATSQSMSLAQFEQQARAAQQLKKPAGRTNSTLPLLEDSSTESSCELESPEVEQGSTLNAVPASVDPVATYERRTWTAKLPPLPISHTVAPPSQDIARPRPGRVSAPAQASRTGAETPKNGNESSGMKRPPPNWRDSLPFEGRIEVRSMVTRLEEQHSSQESGGGSLTRL